MCEPADARVCPSGYFWHISARERTVPNAHTKPPPSKLRDGSGQQICRHETTVFGDSQRANEPTGTSYLRMAHFIRRGDRPPPGFPGRRSTVASPFSGSYIRSCRTRSNSGHNPEQRQDVCAGFPELSTAARGGLESPRICVTLIRRPCLASAIALWKGPIEPKYASSPRRSSAVPAAAAL